MCSVLSYISTYLYSGTVILLVLHAQQSWIIFNVPYHNILLNFICIMANRSIHKLLNKVFLFGDYFAHTSGKLSWRSHKHLRQWLLRISANIVKFTLGSLVYQGWRFGYFGIWYLHYNTKDPQIVSCCTSSNTGHQKLARYLRSAGINLAIFPGTMNVFFICIKLDDDTKVLE